jgi:hypothetical protein
MTYTPTQQRILALLDDQRLHSTSELLGCLSDDMTNRLTLRVHLHYLRVKLKQVGKTVKTIRQGSSVPWYRLESYPIIPQ